MVKYRVEVKVGGGLGWLGGRMFEGVATKMRAAVELREAAEIENALHIAFDPYRVNPSREFFEIDPEQVEVLSGDARHGRNPANCPGRYRAAARRPRGCSGIRQSLTTEREFLGSLTYKLKHQIIAQCHLQGQLSDAFSVYRWED